MDPLLSIDSGGEANKRTDHDTRMTASDSEANGAIQEDRKKTSLNIGEINVKPAQPQLTDGIMSKIALQNIPSQESRATQRSYESVRSEPRRVHGEYIQPKARVTENDQASFKPQAQNISDPKRTLDRKSSTTLQIDHNRSNSGAVANVSIPAYCIREYRHTELCRNQDNRGTFDQSLTSATANSLDQSIETQVLTQYRQLYEDKQYLKQKNVFMTRLLTAQRELNQALNATNTDSNESSIKSREASLSTTLSPGSAQQFRGQSQWNLTNHSIDWTKVNRLLVSITVIQERIDTLDGERERRVPFLELESGQLMHNLHWPGDGSFVNNMGDNNDTVLRVGVSEDDEISTASNNSLMVYSTGASSAEDNDNSR